MVGLSTPSLPGTAGAPQRRWHRGVKAHLEVTRSVDSTGLRGANGHAAAEEDQGGPAARMISSNVLPRLALNPTRYLSKETNTSPASGPTCHVVPCKPKSLYEPCLHMFLKLGRT